MVTTRLRLLLAALSLIGAVDASSQTDVSRPLRIVVAAMPGSPADERIRALLPELQTALRRSILIDNRGFEDGLRAAQAVARSEPNGNTLLLGTSTTHAASPALDPHLPYDPVRDFVAVTQVSATGWVIVGSTRLPGNSIDALVRHANEGNRGVAFGAESRTERLAGEALGRHLKIGLRAVPHDSPIERMQALREGKVDLALLTPYIARPHVHAGRLKAFAITGDYRSPALPEVATLSEQGIEGYDVPSWDGVFAPAGEHPKNIDAIYRAIRQALDANGVRNHFRELGVTPIGSAPAAFAALVQRDVAVFKRFAAPAATVAR